MVPMAQWVGQQGFEALGKGSNPSLYLHFLIYVLRRKIVIPPPLLHEKFRYQNFSETRKGSCTKFFGTVRQNTFDGKTWYPPPLVRNIFRYPNLVKQWKVPLRKFSAQWDKKFSTENLDTPSPALLSINFSIPETFWNTEGFLYEMIRYCETKQFWRKIVIPAPWLILNMFRYHVTTVLKHWRVPLRNVSVLWDKTISMENRDTRPVTYT